jgi:hypothetical protein
LAPNVTSELLRLVGSLELLEPRTKELVINAVFPLLTKKKSEPTLHSLLWMIGRLGSRMPISVGLDRIPNASKISMWIEKGMEWPREWVAKQIQPISLCMMLWGYRTGDRYMDISEDLRTRLVGWLESHNAPSRHLELLRSSGRLQDDDADKVIGESLPLGFRLKV